MPQKQNKLQKLQAELASLNRAIATDLRLPSLRENRLEGFASLFVMVVPLLNSAGEVVFTDILLDELFLILDNRFGGCMVPS